MISSVLLFKSLHGHHTVKFARLFHLDRFVKIVANLCPFVISKLITVVNINKQIHNHAYTTIDVANYFPSPFYDDRGYTTAIDFNIVKVISLSLKVQELVYN